MSRRPGALLAAFAGLGVALSGTVACTADTAPAVRRGVSAAELAKVIEDLNRQAFVQSQDAPSLADTAARQLAAVTPDSAAKSPAASSIRAEAGRVAATASRMSVNGPGAVRAVRVTVATEKQRSAVRIVTLHVSRTLSNGQVWEEMFPYAVVDEDVTGTVLRAGQVYAVDHESGTSGLLPRDLEPYWRD